MRTYPARLGRPCLVRTGEEEVEEEGGVLATSRHQMNRTVTLEQTALQKKHRKSSRRTEHTRDTGENENGTWKETEAKDSQDEPREVYAHAHKACLRLG
ncbi:unnamed protein product [Heligmosomoides polygyrus]|uniref:Uncharacterized protein n=1 Tax=Heligmosomoides polygyrus TaxID=6339 RepID=A0A183FIV5_HELPZ|nr:unnamed protein product [Heligmosomoides polygyrus]